MTHAKTSGIAGGFCVSNIAYRYYRPPSMGGFSYISAMPFVMRIRPRATIRTVPTLRIYLLYFAGRNAPNTPNKSITAQVPSPKENMISAPFKAEPDAAAKSHMLASAPQGISPVSSPMISGLPPLNLHGCVRCGLSLRRNGTPYIIRPTITTSPPHVRSLS